MQVSSRFIDCVIEGRRDVMNRLEAFFCSQVPPVISFHPIHLETQQVTMVLGTLTSWRVGEVSRPFIREGSEGPSGGTLLLGTVTPSRKQICLGEEIFVAQEPTTDILTRPINPQFQS